MAIFQLKNSQGKEVNALYSPTKDGVQLNYEKFTEQILEHRKINLNDKNGYNLSTSYQQVYNGVTDNLEFGYVSTLIITHLNDINN